MSKLEAWKQIKKDYGVRIADLSEFEKQQIVSGKPKGGLCFNGYYYEVFDNGTYTRNPIPNHFHLRFK